MKIVFGIISFVLLAGCTSSSWTVDSIATGNNNFDSSRFQCASTSPLSFEMLQFGEATESFLNLKNFRFSKNCTHGTFLIGGEELQAELTIHEGRMRTKVPTPMTEKIIQALQEGHKVRILVDGFETELFSEDFKIR